MVSINQLVHSILLGAFCSCHVESNADNAVVLQEIVIEMDNMLGVVATASVLPISVVRGIREAAAEFDIHGGKRIGNESCVCLELIQSVSTEFS